MHIVQPKNSSINRYRKRLISPRRFNANKRKRGLFLKYRSIFCSRNLFLLTVSRNYFKRIFTCSPKTIGGLKKEWVKLEQELVTKTNILLFAVPEIYLISLETPYFTFVRDTLSYIVLLLLHYALCLSPTTLPFSGLEWVILIFFTGRYLVERKQIGDVFQHLKTRRESGSQLKCIHIRALSMYQR